MLRWYKKANKADAGIIALVYMSHPEAKEGFGLEIQGRKLYKMFLGRAAAAGVDGIVVGATQHEILKEVAGESAGVFTWSWGTGRRCRAGNQKRRKLFNNWQVDS